MNFYKTYKLLPFALVATLLTACNIQQGSGVSNGSGAISDDAGIQSEVVRGSEHVIITSEVIDTVEQDNSPGEDELLIMVEENNEFTVEDIIDTRKNDEAITVIVDSVVAEVTSSEDSKNLPDVKLDVEIPVSNDGANGSAAVEVSQNNNVEIVNPASESQQVAAKTPVVVVDAEPSVTISINEVVETSSAIVEEAVLETAKTEVISPVLEKDAINPQVIEPVVSRQTTFISTSRGMSRLSDESNSSQQEVNVVVNTPPLAADDELYTKEDQLISGINLLANDMDSDGGTLVISEFSQGLSGGTVSIGEDGLIIYRPAVNFFGKDEFSYTLLDGQGGVASAKVVVWVESVNDVPVANSDSISLLQSQVKQLMLLNNDKGLGDGVSISIASAPSYGQISLSADGKVYYQADDDYFGKDEFVYKVTDSDGDTSLSTVVISIECNNSCTQTFALAWNPSVTPEISGYKLYIGSEPGVYTEVLELGNVTEFEYIARQKGEYFFAVSTVRGVNEESALSEQVSAIF